MEVVGDRKSDHHGPSLHQLENSLNPVGIPGRKKESLRENCLTSDKGSGQNFDS